MIDAVLIEQCADPSIRQEIVQEFIEQVGGDDHLTVTVRSGERVVLVPKANNREEAMSLVQQYVGNAIVRVGVTQYPAGFGIQDVSELSYDLFDSCENIRIGTELFGKVYRIVTDWYGAPAQEAFEDAIIAYRTGWFEGKQVFYELDPTVSELATPATGGGPTGTEGQSGQVAADAGEPSEPPYSEEDPFKADIRIDLSGIRRGDDE
ncbi:conjugal transfer protein TraH [Pelagibacterium halotolerans]|uniref:conjugal transfer protein TraH n=1 Tax=Pelagibacterium halotolerans TaxID=531813 RepID=UPI0038501AA0